MLHDMLIRLVPLFAVLAFACGPEQSHPIPPPTPTTDELHLAGQLLAHDGTRLDAAHVTISRSQFSEPVFDADVDGEFDVRLPGPGAYNLLLAGVDHSAMRQSLVIERGIVKLHARLGTYARASVDHPLPVVVRWVDAAGHELQRSESQTMPSDPHPAVRTVSIRGPDAARAVQIQLRDPVSQRTFNAPSGQRWIYDGDGDYWAEQTIEGRETLEIDLSSLPPTGLEPQIEIEGEGVVRSRQIEAMAVLDPQRPRLQQALDSSSDRDAICEQVHDIALDARTSIEALDDAELRRVAALEWFGIFGQFGPAGCLVAKDMHWVLELVEPDDRAWAFISTGASIAFGAFLDDAVMLRYRTQLAAAQTDAGLRAMLLFLELTEADAHGDDKRARELVATLTREYAGSGFEQASYMLDPDRDRVLTIGHSLPDWQFRGLTGELVTSDALRGHAYLMTVWSTWCGPCVAGMPDLHAAWQSLGGAEAAITFVSVSVDEDAETVATFRREQWPMPWVNAHVPAAEQPALYRAWKFDRVPLHVLVDGEGRIRALGDTLQGAQLLGTLQDFLAGRATDEAVHAGP